MRMLPDLCLATLILIAAACTTSLAAEENGAADPFDQAAFADPPDEFRPLRLVHGFDRMTRRRGEEPNLEGIDRRLAYLRELGVGGIVTNVGREDYLTSPEQWDIYRYGLRKADEMGFVLWLYDESGYPSGTAGGLVVRANPEYAAEGMACYTVRATGPAGVVQTLPLSCKAFYAACAFPTGTQPAARDVVDLGEHVDDWGTLRWQAPEGDWTVLYFARRVMYEGTFATAVPIGHAATRHYINTLNEDAVRAFLRVTHEQYYRETPPELWEEIRAVFTDEPLVAYHYTGDGPREPKEGQRVLDTPFFTDRPPAVPWTDDLPDEFRRAHGYDLRPHLYALFTSSSPETCYVRQNFWAVVADMYARAYFGQIAEWCAEHGTAMSGHVLAEEGMWGNAMFEISVLEIMRRMQIPGIDILTADPEQIADTTFLGAKGVSSAAHLTGKKTVHCECCAFGALPSGERLGLNEFIAQANMLHVMGVNLFTLYQNQRQIGEEAFRTYTDYVGRLSMMLRGGSHVCDVAFLYPVRSAWAWWTPSGRDMELPNRTDVAGRFARVADSYEEGCRTLAQSQVDFDIVDERALRDAQMRDGAMRIADEAYRCIVLWDPQALEFRAAEGLRDFCAAGGTLIAVGQRPQMTGSAANESAFEALMDELFRQDGPASVLQPDEVVGYIREHVGADFQLAQPNDRIFYTHRRRDGRDIYFVVNNRADPVTLRPSLRVPGPYAVYRPLTGDIEPRAEIDEVPLAPYEGVFLVSEAGR